MATEKKVKTEMAAPKPLKNPNHCPGGYSFDAYCKYDYAGHEWDEFPHNFYAQTGAQARKQARGFGWKLHRDGTATCPKCAKALAGQA